MDRYRIYSRFTFEQDCFKIEFLLSNQKSRQNAKNDIKNFFYKLINNANFGFVCRNNANNTKFEPIIDEIGEITYIKKYYNLFDSQVANFVKSDVLEQNINKEYEKNLAMIKENDPFKDARIAEIKNEKKQQILMH